MAALVIFPDLGEVGRLVGSLVEAVGLVVGVVIGNIEGLVLGDAEGLIVGEPAEGDVEGT